MIFFLVGKSSLLLEEKIKEITNKYKRISVENERNFFLELQKNLNQTLWGKKHDLVIYNLEKLSEEWIKRLFFILKGVKDINIIFIFKKSPDEFLRELSAQKIKYEIIYLEETGGKNYELIEGLLRKYSFSFPKNIKDFIKENYGGNIDLLIQDLRRIKALGSKNPEEIKNLLSLQVSIFKIQEAFLGKNWPLFVHYFKKFIFEDSSRNKSESLKIFSLLSNSLIKILFIKKGLKVEGHYFYLQKLKSYSQKVNFEDIKLLLSALAKTDKKFKKFLINIKELPEDISLNYLLSQRR